MYYKIKKECLVCHATYLLLCTIKMKQQKSNEYMLNEYTYICMNKTESSFGDVFLMVRIKLPITRLENVRHSAFTKYRILPIHTCRGIRRIPNIHGSAFGECQM